MSGSGMLPLPTLMYVRIVPGSLLADASGVLGLGGRGGPAQVRRRFRRAVDTCTGPYVGALDVYGWNLERWRLGFWRCVADSCDG